MTDTPLDERLDSLANEWEPDWVPVPTTADADLIREAAARLRALEEALDFCREACEEIRECEEPAAEVADVASSAARAMLVRIAALSAGPRAPRLAQQIAGDEAHSPGFDSVPGGEAHCTCPNGPFRGGHLAACPMRVSPHGEARCTTTRQLGQLGCTDPACPVHGEARCTCGKMTERDKRATGHVC